MLRVLLAEDDVDSADMLARRLRRLGYEVEIASDGRRALEAVEACPPDVLLLDLSLPLLDGWAVAAELRANGATAGIPIVAISAHATPEHIARARDAGCDVIHPKPVDFAKLQLEIQALLGRLSR